jgi:hypothetical protein
LLLFTATHSPLLGTSFAEQFSPVALRFFGR